VALNGVDGPLNIPRDPTRFAFWAISGFLALLGIFFSVVSGVPWPAKESVVQLQRDVQRMERSDDSIISSLRSLELSLQAIQYENRQLREQATWLEAEVDRVKTYVYPQPSGRVPRPKPDPPTAVPPTDLGPPKTKYP
jgi:hypothetical protein